MAVLAECVGLLTGHANAASGDEGGGAPEVRLKVRLSVVEAVAFRRA